MDVLLLIEFRRAQAMPASGTRFGPTAAPRPLLA